MPPATSGVVRGPAGIGDRVVAVVLVLPDDLAGGVVEAEDALDAGHPAACHGFVGRLGRRLAARVGDVDAVAGDGGAGVAGADRRPPADLRPAGREVVEDAVFAPDAVALAGRATAANRRRPRPDAMARQQ